MATLIRALAAKQRADVACGGMQTSLRRCIVTRTERPPEDLVRFVVGPNDQVIPDIARRLPGRGIWVTCHKDALREAVAKHAFARASRRKVNVSNDLPDQLDTLLFKRALEFLSICNKAGLVACGSGKVNSWIEAGADGALVQAADASPDGLAKVARKYRAVRSATIRPPLEVSLFKIDDLSLALGRANVVHAALSKGTAADNFLTAASRAERYRAAQFEASACMVAAKAIDDQPNVIRNTG